MNKGLRRWSLGIMYVFLGMIAISLILYFFASQTFISSLRIVFGSVYVLFLPGFVISYIFFPKTKEFDKEDRDQGSIDWIERIALSFALSIAIVPLAVFYLNLIGIKISMINSAISILGIILFAAGIMFWKNRKSF